MRHTGMLFVLAGAATLLGACTREQPGFDGFYFTDDGLVRADLRVNEDLPPEPDLAVAPPDLYGLDLFGIDFSHPDLRRPPDLAPRPDLSTPRDLAMTQPDLAGARMPCHSGPGFAAFRFHFAKASGMLAILDALGLPDSPNFYAAANMATTFVDVANGGGIELAAPNTLDVYYSVAGLVLINTATLWVHGRSYSNALSGSLGATTPLWGQASQPPNTISLNAPYSWTTLDLTGNVQVGDDPTKTALHLTARSDSNDLVLDTVELCIDGL